MIHLIDIVDPPQLSPNCFKIAFNMVNEQSAEYYDMLFVFSVLSILFIAMSVLIVFLSIRKKHFRL